MLLIFYSPKQLDLTQLMRVYEESLGEKNCFSSTQDFYDFWQYDFFSVSGAMCAVWTEEGEYISAMRLEPYQDGLLVSGLETMPVCRRKGMAAKLMDTVLQEMKNTVGTKIYSHIHRKNAPSLRVHQACGFTFLFDHAVFLDGSVSQSYDTYMIEI